MDVSVHAPGFDDGSWAAVTTPELGVAIVRPMSPPVRRVEEITAVAVTRIDKDGAWIADLGQNINGWGRLDRPRAGRRPPDAAARRAPRRRRGPDDRASHIDLPFLPAPLPVGQVDEVVSAGVEGDVFEPRFTTHGFQYVRIEGHPDPLAAEDVTGVVVHSDLRRTGWFACSDERINRLHEAAVWSLRGNMCDDPHRLPPARAFGVDRGLADLRADRRLSVRRRRLHRQVAARHRPRPARRRVRRQHLASDADRGLRRRPHGPAQRFGRLGRRRGHRAVGPLPGVRRRDPAPRVLGSHDRDGSTTRREPLPATGTRTAWLRGPSRRRTRGSCGTRGSTGANGSSRAST